ncbi:MAG: restriction endonuclease subunit R, partial [Paludibacteraceae bacterium]|nr:restriction endonuclease subunit R [Paludibacteraceae bacterium]
MSPEEKARLEIDKKLNAAGWVIQDLKEIDITASLGVAVREFPTADGHEVDYALFVEGDPVGLIEAKEDNKGVGLTNDAHEQNMGYVKTGLKNHEDEKDELRFIYEATSILTQFTDLKDPEPRVREIFSFHRPETL